MTLHPHELRSLYLRTIMLHPNNVYVTFSTERYWNHKSIKSNENCDDMMKHATMYHP